MDAQAEVIAMAQAMAGFDPATISYIEAHGTGTPLGDPIEIAALSKAFALGTDRRGFCALGSVKTNIGHLDAAAGVAGLIKTVLALENKQIPPSLHFKEPNSRIDFDNTPFYVNSALSEWKRGVTPRRAGVSSFGIGGTNAHVVIEEAPEITSSESTRPSYLLLLSAKSGAALEVASDNLAEFLEANAGVNLADVAYTLQVGRGVFNHRRAVLCRDPAEAARSLRSLDYERVASRFQESVHRPVTFMFPGQGTQYVGMARELYGAEPIFRQHVDTCAEVLTDHLQIDLRELLYPAAATREKSAPQLSPLDQTAFTQPALFTIEYALARLWMEWGVRPAAMIGHSIGEYVVATLAGVMSLEDSLSLVAFRGQLIQSVKGGSMLAVTMPEKDVLPLLDEELSLAAVNGPSLCVVSGPTAAVRALETKVTGQGVIARRLHTSHAFHSKMMQSIRTRFSERCHQIKLNPPSIPYISNVTGTWINENEATDPDYWSRHLCQTVRFAEGVTELLKEPEMALLEVGPGRTLKTATRWNPAKTPAQIVETSLPGRDDQQPDFEFLLSSLGKLWLAGVEVDWQGFYAPERRLRIPLPTYPFERKRYWVEDRPDAAATPTRSDKLRKQTEMADWFYVPVWKESAEPNLNAAQIRNQNGPWLIFANDDSLSANLERRLAQLDQRVFTVIKAAEFGHTDERSYRVDPSKREDYLALFADLQRRNEFPATIVHLWGVTSTDPRGQSDEALQTVGFYSLLLIAQAIGEHGSSAPLQLSVVTNLVQEVTGEELLSPGKTTVLGPCRVIPREYSQINCRSLDITVPEPSSWQEFKLVDQLLAEAASEKSDAVVAYRGGRRWVQRFEQVRLDGGTAETPLLKEHGVYLITGGLGVIGFALADYLGRAFHAKLVLCGRSPFPVKELWDHWLATHTDQDATSEQIRKCRQLEKAGAEVMVASADVNSKEQMQELITHAMAEFGQINGVIHAAGVAGGGLMQLRKPDEAASVLAPKVEGARVIASVCKDLSLDFLVFCSSLSSLIGRPGQVDYCAANAFLDAFAHDEHQRTGSFVVSINWGEWQDLGMAAGDLFAPAKNVHQIRELNHPLLEKSLLKEAGEEIYTTEFNVNKHWVLDEHRLVGNAVIPGVAYFEMVRAALGERAHDKVIELHDVYFVGPLRVRDDQTREVRLVFQPDAEGFNFSVESDSPDEQSGTQTVRQYALGKVRLSATGPVGHYDIDELIAACNVREEIFAEEQREDDLGPRWQSVKKAYVGAAEVLTVLELSEDFAGDFDELKYHPALMDRAVGRPKEYLFVDEYLPVSYKLLKIHGSIPRKIYSYARYRGKDDLLKETLTWDTVVLDENGAVLVEIEGFVQKRINDAATAIKSYAGNDERRLSAPKGEFAETFARGRDRDEARTPRSLSGEMQLAEGIEAFRRILSQRIMPQVAVSVRDLNAVIEYADVLTQERINEEAERPRVSIAAHPRPKLRTDYVAPGSESQRRIASIWQQALGIAEVGIHDNFFELGGDSVQAILIIAALNKAGFQLAPQQFFQYQTIAELSEIVVATPDSPAGSLVSPAQSIVAPTATYFAAEKEASAGTTADFPLVQLDQDEFDKLSLLVADADKVTMPPFSEAGPTTNVALSVDGGTRRESGERLREWEKIEAVLRQHPAVREVVVMAQGDHQEEEDLVAYVVLDLENKGHKLARPMEFSLFYFSDNDRDSRRDKYRLYIDGAKFADEYNFAAIWTPERHFHSSGGLYPSPSVLSAALATVTRKVRLCAGSVVLPLHHPLRVAEEWAVVDNLSDGRVGVSFTSGWIPNDFVFFPERFATKRSEMFAGIEQVQKLWRGESLPVMDGAGNNLDVKIFPRPVQSELPIWLTCSGDPQMFVKAGELGVNVLTALLTQSVEETAVKIALYREALARSGHDPESGRVTLMLHTFVGDDEDSVLAEVRAPLSRYLKSHVDLMQTMATSLKVQTEPGAEEYLDDLIAFAFERYYQTASLIGTPARCLRMIERLRTIGVDEVACFIDFGVQAEAVMNSLPHLNELKNLSAALPEQSGSDHKLKLIPSLLANHVRERLSDDMVPLAFLTLDTFPLNSDGSIDRRALACFAPLRQER
ncbi:MAG: MupA/Atu3671 family FMN-dependent luciferase-like monooxygenase [bacterium]